MKRGLVFSVCALAAALCMSAAQAQSTVDLSLNLRYTDPADPTEGGSWYLVAKTNSAFGISAINTYLSNINSSGIVYGNGGTAANGYPSATGTAMAATLNGGNPLKADFGSIVNVVYGQDTAAGPIVLNVGRGTGTPNNVATDPLRNTAWNNAALIASGSFGAARPAFVTGPGGNITDSNVFTTSSTTAPLAQNGVADANTTFIVRGDSMTTLGLEGAGKGLLPGDANRDGAVNGSDFAILSGNWQGAGGWGQGDFNDSGTVNGSDFAILSGRWQQTQVPVAAVSIPEPASSALVVIAGLFAFGLRRRSA